MLNGWTGALVVHLVEEVEHAPQQCSGKFWLALQTLLTRILRLNNDN